MADVKYQIFVSSTFRDLKDERQAALAAVLELGHFPAGMEAFPAASSTPWDLIRKIIAESDYYILIIGGRYGSTDENGVSYTEKEYDFAIEQGIPTIVYLHADPSQIPAGNCDMNEHAKRRLDDFRQKVSQKHHFKEWKTPSELKLQIVLGITYETRAKPRVGWIKSSDRDSSETLKKLNSLLEQNASLAKEIEYLNGKISEAPVSETKFAHQDENHNFVCELANGPVTVSTTWKQLFMILAPEMTAKASEYELKRTLLCGLHGRRVLAEDGVSNLFRPKAERPAGDIKWEVFHSSWTKICLQFLALGYWEEADLVINVMSRSGTATLTGYRLTALGLRRYAEAAAVLR